MKELPLESCSRSSTDPARERGQMGEVAGRGGRGKTGQLREELEGRGEVGGDKGHG